MAESTTEDTFNTTIVVAGNSSDDPSCPEHMQAEYPSYMLAVTAAMAFIIAILGTCGNLLTIVAIPQNKKLRTPSTAFVLNLAAAELLFCLLILPVSGIQYIHLQYSGGDTHFLSDGACVFFTTARYTITQAELQTVLAIAVTRAIAVSAHNVYSKLNTLKVTVIYIIFIWIYSFAIRIPVAIGVFGKYEFNHVTMECDLSNDNDSTNARKVYNLLEIYLPVPLIIFLYIYVLIMVRCSTRRVETQSRKSRRPTLASVSSEPSTPSTPPFQAPTFPLERSGSISSLSKKLSDHSFKFPRRRSSASKMNARDQRVAKTIFVVFLMIVICSLPVGIEHAVNKKCVKRPIKFLAMHILYWMQYWLNLFVYVIMNHQYRNAYVEYLSKFIPRIGAHKGQRFFWENQSTASQMDLRKGSQMDIRKGSQDFRKGSNQYVRKDSGVPEMPGTPRVLKKQGKFLSAITESQSNSIVEDEAFEEEKQNYNGLHHSEEKICMLSNNDRNFVE